MSNRHASQPNDVLFAAEALAAGESRIGGKALGLARLESLDVTVPPWFVLPTEHFRAHIDVLDVDSGETDADVTVATKVTTALSEREIGNPTRQLVADAVARLGPGPYAVRSSMVGEDSASASFAGLLETYLYVHTAEDVLLRIRDCWASAFTERVTSYRQRQGRSSRDVDMGVVVQRMIDGDVSGVVFTANPITGDREQMLVTACWGLGEGVVSGSCNTDEFVCGHDGAEVSATIADKDVAVRVSESGSGTEERPVAAEQRGVRCLTTGQTAQIVDLARRVASKLGCPQDIEWTVADGLVYLLQSRPITTLPPPPVMRAIPEGMRVVWDNSNIQESYCGVTTPLTFSFASGAYASVYRQTMRALNLPDKVVQDHEDTVQNLLGLVRGRVYYNINNWYRGLLLLPSFGQNKADMERMMGLESPVDFVQDEVLSASQKLRRVPGLASAALRLQRAFKRLDDDVDRFMREFESAYEHVDRAGLSALDISALLDVLVQLRTTMLDRWHVPIVNDFYVMMTNGRLRRIVSKVSDEAERVISDLLSGEEGIESAEPTKCLMRMATEVRADASLSEALRTGTPRAAVAALRNTRLRSEIDAYVEKYGDRSMGELKLETISLREDPGFIGTVLRNYVAQTSLDPEALAARERRQRESAEREVARSLSAIQRRRFGRALTAARTGIANRERMRLARTRMFGLFRDAYLAIGARLAEAGRIDETRDVFYLTVEEIDRCVGSSEDLRHMATSRKTEFLAYESEDVPNRIETVGPLGRHQRFDAEAPSDEQMSARVLTGLGCSPGVAEAQLCVIRDVRDDLSVNGKILTTTRTDPGWAPLFPSAAAILVERGSTLSHSAVLARELGIPAVVGIPNLMAIVTHGEQVRLDGAAGTVTRLETQE